MELNELGNEYLKRCNILLNRISELKRLAEKLNGDEKILIKRRIAMLYDDAEHCRSCAYILINYHRRDEQHDVEMQIQS